MDMRQLKALEIAARSKITYSNGTWAVPSQSSPGTSYSVVLAESSTCTCEDFATRRADCKHVLACRIVLARDGKGTAPVIVTDEVPKKPTYKQDWPAYTRAQSSEKRRVRVLLQELCTNLPDRPAKGSGPKPHRIRDMVFAMAYKVYCGFSARRFGTDLEEAHAMGFTTRPIHPIKATAFFDDAYLTPILKELIGHSARPLRSVETAFAIDSSGFGSSRYEDFFDFKHGSGMPRRRCVWTKVHIASGTKTNIVTAVRILDKDAGDCPQFVPLVKETKKHFTIGEVSADKAYASLENFEEVAACGGQAYIAFKSNTTGAVGGQFEKAFAYFLLNREEYMTHYHKRSNVESTFSSIKRVFGHYLFSRTDTAMVNETLCKILCHNLTCLIHEQEALGIVPVFWGKEEKEEEAGAAEVLKFPQPA